MVDHRERGYTLSMRIFIAQSTWRDEDISHALCMRGLYSHLIQSGISFTESNIIGDALISRSRSQAASLFARSDYDVLFITDSDITFRPEDVVKLCERCLDGHDIIGAAYLTRQGQHGPAVMLPKNQGVVFAPGSQPVEIPYTATGFMAVSKAVVEALSHTLPLCHKNWIIEGGEDVSFWPMFMPFVGDIDGNTVMFSEDWAFAERAKQAGFKVWLDPSIRIGHVGSYELRMEDTCRPARMDAPAMMLTRRDLGRVEVALPEPVG